MLHSKEPIRTRREFVIRSAALSLAALIPNGMRAQDKSQRQSGDAPHLSVIPNDTRLKFNPDGTPRRFAGNTVICHLSQQSSLHDAVAAVSDALGSSSFAKKLAVMPSDSYHATILGGVNDLGRHPSEWPRDIPIEASIEECNRIVGQRFARVKVQEELPIRFRLDRNKTLAPQLACGLQLAPADPSEKLKLSSLRDRLADEVFRYRARNHQTFGFHISLAYQMSAFTSEEKREYQSILEHHVPLVIASAPVIELGVPEFCTFENMNRFDVRTLLRT
jgi:hypothetical protein